MGRSGAWPEQGVGQVRTNTTVAGCGYGMPTRFRDGDVYWGESYVGGWGIGQDPLHLNAVPGHMVNSSSSN